MRIALVIENFYPAAGGAERNLHEVARHLSRRGHDLTVLCGSGVRRMEDLPGLRIETCPTGKPRDAWHLWRFARWADQRLELGGFDASLSVTMAVPATILQPLGGTVRETLRRNVAIREHPWSRLGKRISYGLSPKQRMLLLLERRSLAHPRVRCIAALSRYVVQQIEQGYGVRDGRVRLICNAVDLPTFSEVEREHYRRHIRMAFGIPDDTTAYLFSAFNPRLKGIVPLLHATRHLRDRGIAAMLMLTGCIGYAEQRLAASLGIRDRLRIVGPTQKMGQVFCAVDVTVLPTFYDPASRVVIESLIAGTPTITTSYNGAADLMRRPDGRVCGRVIENPADVEALTEAMAALADPDERQRCREAADGLADELSMARHVDQLERFLVGSDAAPPVPRPLSQAQSDHALAVSSSPSA